MSGDGSSSSNRVLVTAATGKAGFEICLALVDEGFDVHGTTAGSEKGGGAEKLRSIGVTPVVGDRATDFFESARRKRSRKALLLPHRSPVGREAERRPRIRTGEADGRRRRRR
mmetsp:Transcript_2565/g.6954  ORF Transcript_2565/g.6954 Transcript_2565/m.6954 type:complete len:113 (+) Transcript_2565:139-477(+)